NFSSPTYSVSEGAATATITVTRTDGAVGPVSVNYAATAGTAMAGQNFTAVFGTLGFAANEFSKTFTVPILHDPQINPNLTVNLTLSGPVGGAVLGTQAQAVLAITDIDSPGALQFSAANFNVAENVAGGNATVTVSRTGGSNGPVTVQYATVRGSAA